MATQIASPNVNHLMKSVEMTVTLTGLPEFKIRLWLGKQLLRLAAIAIGCGIKIETERGD